MSWTPIPRLRMAAVAIPGLRMASSLHQALAWVTFYDDEIFCRSSLWSSRHRRMERDEARRRLGRV